MNFSTDGMPPRSTRRQRTRWDTQDAAWRDAEPRMGCIADRILKVIETTPSTCDEVEVILGMSHQTASAAINALMRSGRIVATGARPTRSGRSARIWAVPTPQDLFGGKA